MDSHSNPNSCLHNNDVKLLGEVQEVNVWRRGGGGRGWGVVERDDLKGGDG